MKIISVERQKDTVLVTIIPRVENGKYSFVNLTYGHICKCQFDTYEQAIEDLENEIRLGNVIRYNIIGNEL